MSKRKKKRQNRSFETAHQLTIPPAAIADSDSIELIRAWIADEGLHCSLKVGVWQGPEVDDETTGWGILLADVIRHVADDLHRSHGRESGRTIDAIRAVLESELDEPTAETMGSFFDDSVP